MDARCALLAEAAGREEKQEQEVEEEEEEEERGRRHVHLHAFRRHLHLLGIRHSSRCGAAVSCLLFLLFALLSPALDAALQLHPHTHLLPRSSQISHSALASISFLTLLVLLRLHGLSRLLLVNEIEHQDSTGIRCCYNKEIKNAFPLLSTIVLPFFLVEFLCKVLALRDAAIHVPHIHHKLLQTSIICAVSMISWIYRTSVFLFVCIVFRLLCSVQMHRFQSFYTLLEAAPPVLVILQEHMRLRDQLFTISHRFRVFLVATLFIITLSQLATLFELMVSNESIGFERIGDVLGCCTVQLVGLVLCLHGAAKVTHKAQRIVSIVSQWHAVASCVDDDEAANPSTGRSPWPVEWNGAPQHPLLEVIYPDSCGDLEASLHLLHCTRNAMSDSYSYQKRHALVTYLHHCGVGISMYGFMMDRSFLHTVFALELSLVLWILGLT